MNTPQMAKRFAIGLDIGGTSMVAGVIEAQTGQLVSRASIPTNSRSGASDGLRRIAALIEQVAAEANADMSDVAGIGIGCTGPIDSLQGVIQNPYTLPGWEDLPLLEHLRERFHRPLCLLNDCHAAALGEFWIGAGKGSRHLLYITVGTGIGSGLILAGRLYRGNGLLSGEVGHLAIDPAGPLCYCGARGCLEMLAAGPAIAAQARNAPDGSRLSTLAKQSEGFTAHIVCTAAREGDFYAQSVITQAAHYLGVGIANLLNVLVPDVVVLGGGVMQSWTLFQPEVEAVLKERDGMLKHVHIRLLPAALGLNAGIAGAAFAVLQEAP